MHARRLARFTLAQKGAVTGLAVVAMLAGPLAADGFADIITLWNQRDNAVVAGTPSSTFEDSQFDAEAADDFTVAEDLKWKVKRVNVDGAYTIFPATPAAFSIGVFFYRDSSGLPGAPVYSYPFLNQLRNIQSGDFEIRMPPGTKFRPGRTYWVSVVANFAPAALTAGQNWRWADRSVQSGNPAVWRNPGGGYGIAGCTSFAVRATTCAMDPSAPDQVFSLAGKAVAIVP